ncbi:MAG: prephenate dehydrogenase [Anaerolineales bacterium]|nr:prephenate dehydrogenase [Anaerolineales bacterium]
MTIQITIIGLGQIGASIGLALADQKELLHRTGYDRESLVARQAQNMGAVDRVENNLPKAVRGADLVLLALPIDQIRDTLPIIAPNLKQNAVVMDTGPIKEIVATWAGEFLPGERHYIGLTPVINPAYLHDSDAGINAARADLFRGGLMAIVTPARAGSEAIKLSADLTRLLGAMPLFFDPAEIDGLMAATHLLPQLMAAALLNATIDQPGWREGRKVAGRGYAEATGPLVHLDDALPLKTSVMLNRENVLRVMDSAIAALGALRNDIAAQDEEALEERLERARRGRMRWWQERQVGDWTGDGVSAVDLPDTPGMLGQLFGLGRKPKDAKKRDQS